MLSLFVVLNFLIFVQIRGSATRLREFAFIIDLSADRSGRAV
jgi:hypothetical protein